MAEFTFDPAPTPGTNRTGLVTDCETCGGDRLVETEPDVYMRCPKCNAGKDRKPVPVEAWWKE